MPLSRSRRRPLTALLAVLGLAACGPKVIDAGGAASNPQITDVVAVTNTTAPANAAAYVPGDCLTWDTKASTTDFMVVPCEDDHLVEVTSPLDLSARYGADAALPSGDELSQLATASCGPVAEAYLDRKLTAEEPGIIPPSPASWAQGDRTFWCTVGLLRVGGNRPAYTGSLRNK
jgi:hypothetical protein